MAFKTTDTEARAELDVKKSRFLAVLVPINRFEATLEQLRTDHRKANHHVTAFRSMREDNRIEEGAKDDGEPTGTSGMPVLKTMIGAGLVDCGLIVVRYFGGIKLGAGGLSRAYSGAARRVIDTASLRPWHRLARRRVTADFSAASDLEQRVAALGLTVAERNFGATGVDLIITGPQDRLARLDAD